jgi:DNA-binding HxlR family transcriptional regulator
LPRAEEQEIAPREGTCPTTITLRVVRGKWKLVILWYIWDEARRFNELKRSIAGITQRMLTQQLRELERDGVVSRKVYAQVPPRVEYAMTEFGRTLEPILRLMCKWGEEHARRVNNRARQVAAEAGKSAALVNQ